MENKQTKTYNHQVVIDNCKKINITDVTEVISVQDQSVVLKTHNNTMHITGSDLRVEKLSLEDGNLIIAGNVYAVKYNDVKGKKSLFSKLFK